MVSEIAGISMEPISRADTLDEYCATWEPLEFDWEVLVYSEKKRNELESHELSLPSCILCGIRQGAAPSGISKRFPRDIPSVKQPSKSTADSLPVWKSSINAHTKNVHYGYNPSKRYGNPPMSEVTVPRAKKKAPIHKSDDMLNGRGLMGHIKASRGQPETDGGKSNSSHDTVTGIQEIVIPTQESNLPGEGDGMLTRDTINKMKILRPKSAATKETKRPSFVTSKTKLREVAVKPIMQNQLHSPESTIAKKASEFAESLCSNKYTATHWVDSTQKLGGLTCKGVSDQAYTCETSTIEWSPIQQGATGNILGNCRGRDGPSRRLESGAPHIPSRKRSPDVPVEMYKPRPNDGSDFLRSLLKDLDDIDLKNRQSLRRLHALDERVGD